MAAKIKRGDNVVVITGKDKGKSGKVLSINSDAQKVLVEGINQVMKHRKPTQANPKGERRKEDRPLHVSNVMLADPETGKPTRVRMEMKDGVKHRIAVRSGADIGRV